MRCKRILIMILVVITLMCMTSCQEIEKVDKPHVPMQTVTIKGTDGYIDIEAKLPKGWIPYSTSGFVFEIYDSNSIDLSDFDVLDSALETIPHTLSIYNYNPGNSENIKEEYESYFNGKFPEKPETVVEDAEWEYSFLKGKYGRLLLRKGNYTYNGKEYIDIMCYREDIPYAVHGTISMDVELSSGELVPYIASTLKTT